MKTFKMVGMALAAILMCVNFVACSTDDSGEMKESQICKVSLNCIGEILDITKEPLSRSETSTGVYSIKVITGNNVYAEGSFASVENLTIDLLEGDAYNFIATYEPNSTDTPTNEFDYELKALTNNSVVVHSNYELSDAYYGVCEDYTPAVNKSVEIFMKRMAFGLKVLSKELGEGATIKVNIRPKDFSIYKTICELSSNAVTHEGIYIFDCFSDVYKGVLVNDEYVNYFEEALLQIILKRVDGVEVVLVEDKIIELERNRKTNITINVGQSDTTISNGATITLEDEEMVNGKQFEVDGEDKTIVEVPIEVE